jgi:hypothetical protein
MRWKQLSCFGQALRSAVIGVTFEARQQAAKTDISGNAHGRHAD